MLNKRIKSMLVAGLVILGMGFAKVDSFAAETLKSEITDIDFVEGEEQKVIELQQGYITVTINREADGKYDVIVKWDKTMVNVIGIDSLFESGNPLYSDFNTCYDVEYEGNNIIVTIKDVNEMPEGFNPVGELIGVNVHFTLVDSDNDGVPDFKDDTPKPEEPEKPKDPNVKDPETGDASMIAIIGIAVASATGLVLTRKKDDEE
jgi:LPXTG-motif cell wall-anchored protein